MKLLDANNSDKQANRSQNFPVVVLNVGAMSSVKYASGIISCNDQSMKAVCEVSYEFLYLASKVDVFHKR